jgi:hypothetical protein
MSEVKWAALSRFFQKSETIRRHFDYLDFVAGGKRRRIRLNQSSAELPEQLRGSASTRRSARYIEAVKYGYFDDLMIGNFVKTNCTMPRLILI